MRNRLKDILKFWNGTADEHMGAFAAQSAFFLFLSFFPIISLLISIPRFLPFTKEEIVSLICNVIPSRFEETVVSVVNEIYQGGSESMTIFSALVALWSASKGLMAIRNGLNEVYRSRENRNYLAIRGISAFYTVIFMVLIIVLIPVNMFGTQIVQFLLQQFPKISNVAVLVYGIRTAATFVVLFLLFWLLYTVVPMKKVRFLEQVPGALFTAFAWVAVTRFYSFYIDNYASRSYMYGSLTTVIMLMFWLYFVIYMMFVGGQINEYRSQCKAQEKRYDARRYQTPEGNVFDDDKLREKTNFRHNYATNEVIRDVDQGVEENVREYLQKTLADQGKNVKAQREKEETKKVVDMREAAKHSRRARARLERQKKREEEKRKASGDEPEA